MKKYIISAIVLGLIVVGVAFFVQTNNENKPVVQKNFSYQYSTNIWTKVPLHDDSPYNADLELYPTGADRGKVAPVATIVFPDKLIRKEQAALLGTKNCLDPNGPDTEEAAICRAIKQRGIAITIYPEPYQALIKKFNDEFIDYGEEVGTTVGGRTGKVFTQQVELEGRSFYVFPMDKNSTLIALVDYNGNDKEYTDFTAAQLNVVVASAKLE